jgi:hypothetical protein
MAAMIVIVTSFLPHAGAGGKFSKLFRFFSRLAEIGPNFSCFPEPSKSILVVPPAQFGSRPIIIFRLELQDHGWKTLLAGRLFFGR